MSAEQAIRISEACDRFEWGWIAGTPARIEDVLAGARPEDRDLLVEPLLRIEVEWRILSGERPCEEDYEGRLPHHPGLVRLVLDEDCGEDPAQVVGGYRLVEEIGRGAEGIVYRAVEAGIAESVVAVKLMRSGVGASREAAARFVREVSRLSRVDHPHIVAYRGSGDDRGQLYYAMRYIAGSSLAEHLRKRGGPLDPLDAVRLLIPVADAVAHLHAQSPAIVHRDLKPENILLDEAGRPHVGDFGLAVLLDGSGLEGGACGTVPYIAPEQLDARFGEVGPASDLYSLGVILYEMIAGGPPFSRKTGAILRTLGEEPTRPSRLARGIPDELERICLRCLRKPAADRYASAAVLAEELRRFERGEPLRETPPDGPWQRLRHWARSEPALAARLAVIVACSAILWGYPLVTGTFAPLAPGHWALHSPAATAPARHGATEAVLVVLNQVVLIGWGLASWAFQRRLARQGRDGGLQLGWRVADVVALVLLLQLDDALMSPLTVAFAVLIAASAFWARSDQILGTTMLSMAGYLLLVLLYRLGHPGLDRPYRHFHFLVGLALLGLILNHQAKRTRALARACGVGGRPLPTAVASPPGTRRGASVV